MIQGRVLHSILRKDGKNYNVKLFDWGVSTLEGDELEKFKADMDQMSEFYKNETLKKKFIEIPLNETVVTEQGHTVSVRVGSEFIHDDDLVRPLVEIEWYQRMSQDPNIIKFNNVEYT
jgi:hypothetical protein